MKQYIPPPLETVKAVVTTAQANKILDNFQNQRIGVTPAGGAFAITEVNIETRWRESGYVTIEVKALNVPIADEMIPIAELLPGMLTKLD